MVNNSSNENKRKQGLGSFICSRPSRLMDSRLEGMVALDIVAQKMTV